MSTEDATNPVAEEELVSTAAEGVADEAQAQGDEPQLDDEGNPIEGEPEEDTEEIERNGQKYRIPKALKGELLMQEDYTRKTQEVAEHRRALDAHRSELSQQAEAQAATLAERVQLATIDSQLEQYSAMDWGLYAQTYGAEAATTAMAQWQQLRDAKISVEQTITAKEQEHRLSSERVVATALQEAEQILSREVPGYSRELVSHVAQIAQSSGFTVDELRDSFVGADGKADTRTFKALARLHAAETELATLKAKTTTAQRIEKQQTVTPAKTVSARAGQYKPGLNDELPTDEWMRRRTAQLAKANGR